MTTRDRATPAGPTRVAGLVLLGCLVCQMGLGMSYVFATFLKPIVEDFGWSRAQYALGVSPLLLSMALSAPLIGDLADRFGPRAVLSASTLLLAATLALFSQMTALWHYYAISLLFGIALTGLGDIPVGAVAARWFSGGRGLALGLVYAGSNLGGAAVPNLATQLAARASWQAALLVLSALALVVILPFAAAVVRNPPAGAPRTGAGPRTAAPEDVAEPEAPGLGLRDALRTRSFWILALALFGFYFYYLGVLNHLVAFLSDLGLSDARAAFGFSLAVFVGIAGKLGIGLVADRISVKRALLLNFAVLTAASFLLLAARLPGALPAFLILHGVTVAAENVLLPLVVAHCFGVANMARIYGVLMLALLPGGAGGAAFAGYVFDATGSYAPAFTTFALLNLATLALLLLVRRERARGSGPGRRAASGPPSGVGPASVSRR